MTRALACSWLPAIVSLLLATGAQAVQITLKSAWMRPAATHATAKVYVDIVSDTALTLTGATTPVAQRVDLVEVIRYDGTDPGRLVKSMPVAVDRPTRLAYLGSHLRLVKVGTDLLNGSLVPVSLHFEDAGGQRYSAQAQVVVRGLLLEREPGAEPRTRVTPNSLESEGPVGADGAKSPSRPGPASN